MRYSSQEIRLHNKSKGGSHSGDLCGDVNYDPYYEGSAF